jgi:hypothetical protein
MAITNLGEESHISLLKSFAGYEMFNFSKAAQHIKEIAIT